MDPDEVDDDVLRQLDGRTTDDGGDDMSDADGELLESEVGGARSARLADYGDGTDDHEFYADDVGGGGAAVSAEESAVHVTGD